MKILTPNVITLDESKMGLGTDDVLVSYDPQSPLRAEDYDADVLISWGNTAEQLKDAAENLHQVKLVQALLAGPDQARAAGFRSEAIICSGVGLHSLTVAEHTLALALNFVRFLPVLAERQRESSWAGELGGVQELHPDGQLTTLLDSRVLIWGFGSIGQATARLFQAFGAQVTGVAHSAGERAGFPVIAVEDIEEHLPQTDLLVMILPSSEDTLDALNRERLRLLPSHAFVINVGRGMTVNEDDLVEALEDGVIAGAAIDVTKQEPLPADSVLWRTKNLVITPHAAGGRPVNPEELIAHNLGALREYLAKNTDNFRNKMTQ